MSISGFVGGDANQWQPNLFRNTTQIYPFDGKPGWNLITGMADDAIDWITRMHQTDPSKPIFIKYAPGATHAPHHPTKEWVDKFSAMHLFDDGYEKVRERIFENQKRLGVIPKDLGLSPWPNEMLKPWDQLGAEEKKLFIRQVEIFAAYAAYNDHEIGRVIQAFEDLGKLDNTLIIYINGDNGTSAEGGPLGTPNEVAFFNGVNMMPVAEQMKWYDVWGTEQTYNHMSAGWSWLSASIESQSAAGPSRTSKLITTFVRRLRRSGRSTDMLGGSSETDPSQTLRLASAQVG